MRTIILFGLLFVFSSTMMKAQTPVNDDCSNAILVSCGDVVTGDTTQATQADEPIECNTFDIGDAGGVWYTFAGTGDLVTVSLCGDPSFDTQIAVYSGNCFSLTCVDGNDQFCGNQSEVTFTSDASTNYYIYIFGWIDAVGTYELEVTCAAPPPPVTNDLCDDALPIACGDNFFATTVGATQDDEPVPLCGVFSNGTAPGVWYDFAGTGDIVTVSLCGSDFDTQLQVFSGNCLSLTCVAGNNDNFAACGPGNNSQLTFLSDAATDYLFYVNGFGASTGNFNIEVTCITPPPPPANDNCEEATVALVNEDETCTLLNPATLAGATPSEQPNDCLGQANDDVWFEFTATTEIHIIQLLNIAGGTTNLVHAVYEGADCDNLTQISCSDPNDSTIQNLTIGDTYYLRIWSNGNDALNLTTLDVCISSFFPPPPPPNDECDDAIVAGVNQDGTCTITTPGTLTGATDSQITSACPGSGDDDVWFEFTATNDAHQISLLNIVGTVTDLVHAVYTGPDCDNLTEIFCSDANISNSSDFIIGQTYYIRVYSFTAVAFQEVTFDVCINEFDTIIVNSINDPETTLSPEELVEQVFVEQGGCGSVDITITEVKENPAGITNISQRSWGYFRQGTTDFPLEDGIILSSGFANTAEAPNNASGTSGGGIGAAWPGDLDIQAILDNQYGTVVPTQNATSFEFEFVSNLPSVTFEFIFASEEYEDDFECTDLFRDGFAFLVRGPGIPDTSGAPFGGVNIASIEGTANFPVTTETIRREAEPGDFELPNCVGQTPGVDFFPDLYVSNDDDSLNEVPISFDGLTVSLTTAEVTVEPGEVYTIKMVIADRSDTAFDSAVFLKGGSFNLGDLDLGDDVTIDSGDAVCEGDVIELNAGEFENGVFEWQQDGVVIADATTGILEVTETGTYTVTITFPGTTCELTDDIFVEFFSIPEIDLGEDVLLCAGENSVLDGTPINLADLENVTYQWQLDGVDITGETNPTLTITTPGIYTITISSIGGCVATDEITVTAVNFTVSLGENQEFCGEESFEIIPIIEGADATNATYLWSTGATTPTLVVTQSAFYEVEVTIEGCIEIAGVDILLKEQPIVVINGDENEFVKCTFDEETLTTTLSNITDDSAVTYQWFFQGGVITGETNNTLLLDQNDEEGIYSVEVNNQGCIASDTIEVVFYANTNCIITQGISPNGDGFNDSVDLTYLETEGGVSNFSIFNRYGTLVFERENYVNDWFGQDMDNNELPVGNYYYVIELNNPQDPITGFIYLNR